MVTMLACDDSSSSDDSNPTDTNGNGEEVETDGTEPPVVNPDEVPGGDIIEDVAFDLSRLTEFEERDVLVGLAKNVSIPTHELFSEQLEAMKTNIDTYCQSQDEADLVDLKESWKTAIATFQRLDTFTWGPMAKNNDTLRFEIYSWPQTNFCRIDREVVKSEAQDYALAQSFNRKGLDALEYLIFDDDLTHACTAAVPQTQGWNALPVNERIENRCRYQRLLIDDLLVQNKLILNSWKEENGALVALSSEDLDIKAEINRLTDTLFYLDKKTKDAKLLVPLGLSAPCASEACVASLEHELSGTSIQAVYNNLIGFQSVLEGFPIDPSKPLAEQRKLAPGLNVLFAKKDGLQFVANFTEKIESAKAIAVTILENEDAAAKQIANQDSFCAAAQNADSGLCQLVAKIKAVTDDLKTEFASILGVKVPATAAGDND